MRVVTGSASHVPLFETFGPHQGLGDEGRLAEAAVLVEALARELRVRAYRIGLEELPFGRVIELSRGARLADGRLHVTLGADRHELARADLREIDGRIDGALRVRLALEDRLDVPRRWPVAHLAVDSR